MAASGLDDLNFTMKEITGSGSTSDETFTASVVPESSSTLSLSEDNKLVCVEYPGIISNVDKMLESIGGIQGMSKVSKQF